jgi:hypothetical protein
LLLLISLCCLTLLLLEALPHHLLQQLRVLRHALLLLCCWPVLLLDWFQNRRCIKPGGTCISQKYWGRKAQLGCVCCQIRCALLLIQAKTLSDQCLQIVSVVRPECQDSRLRLLLLLLLLVVLLMMLSWLLLLLDCGRCC